MNSTIWAPLVGIWLFGMFVAAIVVRTRSIRYWLTTAVDLAVFAGLCIAVVAGMTTISERSQELFGVPTAWVHLAWCLVCLRGLLILKNWHEHGKARAIADAT